MKYTLQEVKQLLLKEIEETQQWTVLLINDMEKSEPREEFIDNSLYDTFIGLNKTRENLEIIFDNLVEYES